MFLPMWRSHVAFKTTIRLMSIYFDVSSRHYLLWEYPTQSRYLPLGSLLTTIMPSAGPPLVDPQNPLYCPAISPSSYLSHLRRNQGSNEGQRVMSGSFARLLVQALDAMPSVSAKLSSGSLYAHLPPLWEYDDESTLTVCDSVVDSLARNPHGKSRPSKRKRLYDDSGNFPELKGPSKYARSCPSAHDSSFEVRLTRDTLHYSGLVSSPPEIASEDTRSEVDHLRARIRILEGPVKSHITRTQAICAYRCSSRSRHWNRNSSRNQVIYRTPRLADAWYTPQRTHMCSIRIIPSKHR